jgi:hypothetical protein
MPHDARPLLLQNQNRPESTGLPTSDNVCYVNLNRPESRGKQPVFTGGRISRVPFDVVQPRL